MINTYGPNTCILGFVWREADVNDWACVAPSTRSQVALDNSLAKTRWYPGPYGPNTCISGYVWRDAYYGDLVCVIPDFRNQAKSDSSAGDSRLMKKYA